MIAHRYNILLDKINALIQETVQKETAQSHAQLKALQYQINPHFIYNTLSVSPDTPRKTDRIPLQNLSLLSVRFCVIILKMTVCMLPLIPSYTVHTL